MVGDETRNLPPLPPSFPPQFGDSALHLAAMRGHAPAVALLLEDPLADLAATDRVRGGLVGGGVAVGAHARAADPLRRRASQPWMLRGTLAQQTSWRCWRLRRGAERRDADEGSRHNAANELNPVPEQRGLSGAGFLDLVSSSSGPFTLPRRHAGTAHTHWHAFEAPALNLSAPLKFLKS